MSTSPCKDCCMRVESCHSTCKHYKKFKEIKEIERDNRAQYIFNKDVVINSMLRNRKNR